MKNFEIEFDGEPLTVDVSQTYGNGRVAVRTFTRFGEAYCNLSVNVPEFPLGEGQFILDETASRMCPKLVTALEYKGWIRNTGVVVSYGLVEDQPVYVLTEPPESPELKEYIRLWGRFLAGEQEFYLGMRIPSKELRDKLDKLHESISMMQNSEVKYLLPLSEDWWAYRLSRARLHIAKVLTNAGQRYESEALKEGADVPGALQNKEFEEFYRSVGPEISEGQVTVGGKLVYRNRMGPNVFYWLLDTTGRTQVLIQNHDMEKFLLWSSIPLGSVLQVSGPVRRLLHDDRLTVMVQKLELISGPEQQEKQEE